MILLKKETEKLEANALFTCKMFDNSITLIVEARLSFNLLKICWIPTLRTAEK